MSAISKPTEDLVVLLDEHGRLAGTAERGSVHGSTTPLHLAFSCYVFDQDDRLLITRRAAAKTFGGVWTNSFCGHPRPGERLEDAVVRRAHDELRLDVAEVRLVLPAFRYRAEQDGIVENEMCPVFTVRAVGAMRPDPTEIDDFAWVEWNQFSEQVCAGTREISPWCRSQIERLRELGRPGTWPPASTRDLPPAAQPSSG